MNEAILLNEDREDFVIDTPGKADWAIKKIKEERQLCDIFVLAAQQNIDMLNKQIKDRQQYVDDKTANLMLQLSDWFDGQPGKEAKTQKSLVLPSGKLIQKFSKKEYQKDEKQLIESLTGTQYVEDVPKLKWADLKKDLQNVDGVVMLASTGEVLEGVTLVEKPATFSVE